MTKGRYLLEIKHFSDAFFDVCDQFKALHGEDYVFSQRIDGSDFYLVRNQKSFSLYRFGSNKVYRRLLDGHYDHAYSDLLKAFIDALEEDEENVDV